MRRRGFVSSELSVFVAILIYLLTVLAYSVGYLPFLEWMGGWLYAVAFMPAAIVGAVIQARAEREVRTWRESEREENTRGKKNETGA